MNRRVAGKDKDSDDEQEQEQQVALTPQQIEEEELQAIEPIGNSEISPAAFIFEQQEHHDELNLYEEKSTKVKCPYCDCVSNSIVEYRPSLLGYLLTVLAILIFGILSLVLLPLLVSLTKQAIHRCAKCLNEVRTNSYFGLSSMQDEVLTFKIGTFGVILTRKMLFYAVMVITAALAIYAFVWVESKHHHDNAPITGITWATFSAEVGHSAWLKNKNLAQRNFIDKYVNHGVHWEGYVVRILLAEDDNSPQSMYHSATVFVKMNINDQEGVNGADLGLSLTEEALLNNKEVLNKLRTGDHISFEGSLQALGDSHHLHHLHSWSINKIDGHMDGIDVKVFEQGRYKLSNMHSEPHVIEINKKL